MIKTKEVFSSSKIVYLRKSMSLLSENSRDRVMMFIDLQNILRSVEAIGTMKFSLDLYALAIQLTGTRQLVGAYVFDTRMPFGVEDRLRRFHDRLRYLGFRVVARESFDEQRQQQKEVDVALACELVAHAFKNNYDVAILVSGDRDFIPAIQHAQLSGKRVEVAAFANSASTEIRRSADRFHQLETMPLLSFSGAEGEDISE
jgi:uncharacterized LabA/DUF88 family protein